MIELNNTNSRTHQDEAEADFINKTDELIKNEKLLEAETVCKAYLAKNPNSSECFNQLGGISFLKNDFLSAKSLFERAVLLDENNLNARNNLTELSRILGIGNNADTIVEGKHYIIAKELESDYDLMGVDTESEFSKKVKETIKKYRPKKIIETGTYLGTGTTQIIASSLREEEINDAVFYTIEVNPLHFNIAVKNLMDSKLLKYVKPVNGLSLPRSVLPSKDEISNRYVNNIVAEEIFVDHDDSDRAERYFDETNFEEANDSILDYCLEEFEYSPDLILLDSAGHIGREEFFYVIEKLRKECIVVLDDTNHIKHYESVAHIKKDSRFEIIHKSNEKFGFCISKFTPCNNAEKNVPLSELTQTFNKNADIEKLILSNEYEFQINFDLNDGCNLNCVFCGNVPNKNYKTQNIIDKKIFKEKFLPVFSYANNFQFGCFFEPLMVPYFEEAVWDIRNYLQPHVKGTIISNGMMLTQSKIKTIIDSCIFKRVRFSIDSTSEELFEKIRGGAKLNKFLEHIKELVKYRNEQNSPSLVEFNFTITKENINQLPGMVKLAKEYGVDSITTHKLAPNDILFVETGYYNDLIKNLDEASSMAKNLGVEFMGQTYWTEGTYKATVHNEIKKTCGYYKHKYLLLVIDSFGNINNTCIMTDKKLGNLFENSFEEIVSNNSFTKLFNSIKTPDTNQCVNCGMFI